MSDVVGPGAQHINNDSLLQQIANLARDFQDVSVTKSQS